jgi:hypothetical protein
MQYIAFFNTFFLLLSVAYIFIAHYVQQNTQVKLYVYLFILRSVCSVSRGSHADQILPKFSAPQRRLSGPALWFTQGQLYLSTTNFLCD